MILIEPIAQTLKKKCNSSHWNTKYKKGLSLQHSLPHHLLFRSAVT